MTDALDLSNYTSSLTPEALEQWKTDGIKLVIIQAVDPPPGYPTGKTREQIQQCLDAGLAVDAYVWLWFDLDIADIERKLALLEGFPIRQVWLDVEDQAAAKYDMAACEIKVRQALERCDEFPTTLGRPTGVYSGAWYWADPKYMNNTAVFSDRLLWDALYDGMPDASVFSPYGGWQECVIKQYQGTSTFGGVSGVDLNVLSAAELAALESGGGDVADCQTYRDALERVVNRLQIEDERKSANGQAATLRRSIIREIASEAFAALQS